jgi:hypothetical protein
MYKELFDTKMPGRIPLRAQHFVLGTFYETFSVRDMEAGQ